MSYQNILSLKNKVGVRVRVFTVVIFFAAIVAGQFLYLQIGPQSPLVDSANAQQPDSSQVETGQFLLECGILNFGYFSEINGLGSYHELVEQRVVNDYGTEIKMKLPSALNWPEITLTRQLSTNLDLWQWREQAVKNDFREARKTCSIKLMDEQLRPLVQWNLRNAWPVKITVFQAGGPDVVGGTVMEEVVIAHDELRLAQ